MSLVLTAECSPPCTGLMRCTGSAESQTCCNFFDMSGACVSACPDNSQPDPTTFECECNPGLPVARDMRSCVVINQCDPSPCQNGGTCSPDMINGFSCTCAAGYEGDTCEIEIDECTERPCQNGGLCMDLFNDFLCRCGSGYEGRTCETDINECEATPCLNGGTCTNMIGDFSCTCVPGYEGDTCETDINECEANPCLNGGTCTNLINDFSCACVSGYEGDTCNMPGMYTLHSSCAVCVAT